jgi:hypothetical protein
MINDKPYAWLDDNASPMTLHVDVSSTTWRTFSFAANPQQSSGSKLIVKCNLSSSGSNETEDNLPLDSNSGFDPSVHTRISVLLMNGTTVKGSITLMV